MFQNFPEIFRSDAERGWPASVLLRLCCFFYVKRDTKYNHYVRYLGVALSGRGGGIVMRFVDLCRGEDRWFCTCG